jgi:hypothetical protein
MPLNWLMTKSIDAISLLWNIIQRIDMERIIFRILSNAKNPDKSPYWLLSHSLIVNQLRQFRYLNHPRHFCRFSPVFEAQHVHGVYYNAMHNKNRSTVVVPNGR